MPTRTTALASLLLASLLLPAIADAQRRGRDWPPQQRRERPMLAIEGGGLFSSQTGEALGNVGDGTGFDVMASVGSGLFSIGGGYQRARHPIANLGGDATVGGGFIEPRLATAFSVGNFTPYLFGRAARLTRRASALADEPDVTGTALGGGVGTLFWLAPNLQLNSSLLWQELRFDRAAGLSSPILSSNRVNGTQWSLRAGLSVGFDRWGR
jgi:hypothetical protein